MEATLGHGVRAPVLGPRPDGCGRADAGGSWRGQPRLTTRSGGTAARRGPEADARRCDHAEDASRAHDPAPGWPERRGRRRPPMAGRHPARPRRRPDPGPADVAGAGSAGLFVIVSSLDDSIAGRSRRARGAGGVWAWTSARVSGAPSRGRDPAGALPGHAVMDGASFGSRTGCGPSRLVMVRTLRGLVHYRMAGQRARLATVAAPATTDATLPTVLAARHRARLGRFPPYQAEQHQYETASCRRQCLAPGGTLHRVERVRHAVCPGG